MNLGQTRLYLAVNLRYLILIDEGSGLIFREVIGKFNCGELDVGDPASNQHDSNPATVTPLLCCLSTKHNLIDLTKKAFPTSESKNT